MRGSQSTSESKVHQGGSPARAQTYEFDATSGARVQATLDRVRDEERIPGVSAALVIAGKTLWTGMSGEADTRTHERVTDRTLFAAGSITKTFMAALTLRLVEDGVLDLDDHLSRWVPEFPNSGQITLRQVLNHTSGIADFTQSRAYGAALDRNPAASWMPQRTLRYMGPPVSAPGSEWHYSSTNYILLGLVIERATRSGVARELHRRLLDRRTFPRLLLQGDERPIAPVASGHFNFDNDTELEHTLNDPYVPTKAEAAANWTAGGIMATARDLARAGDGILAGRLLSARSRREMTRFIPALYPPEYGLGLGQDTLAGTKAWGHPGDVVGFHAEMWYLPKYRATIAVLGNYQTGEYLGSQRALAEVLTGDIANELTKRHDP